MTSPHHWYQMMFTHVEQSRLWLIYATISCPVMVNIIVALFTFNLTLCDLSVNSLRSLNFVGEKYFWIEIEVRIAMTGFMWRCVVWKMLFIKCLGKFLCWISNSCQLFDSWFTHLRWWQGSGEKISFDWLQGWASWNKAVPRRMLLYQSRYWFQVIFNCCFKEWWWKQTEDFLRNCTF